MSTSSSYSNRIKNGSDISNRSSVKSVEMENYTKVKKKRVIKKKQKVKEIHQPPLHFDFNFNMVSSSPPQKEVLSISGDTSSIQKPKSVYNSSIASKRNDSISTISAKSHNFQNKSNADTNIVRLPPPSKPNFIRKSQETLVKANFDDRWQLYLEMKALDDARNRIYFKVYFYKWKAASSNKFIERIREKTSHFESVQTSQKINNYHEQYQNMSKDDAAELINKARRKYNEYTSFLSEFEGQVSNFVQIPNQINNNDNKINDNINMIQRIKNKNINNRSNINSQIDNNVDDYQNYDNQNEQVNNSNAGNYYNNSNHSNYINNSNQSNYSNRKNSNNNSNQNNYSNNSSFSLNNSLQRQTVNISKNYVVSKNENEEDNSSAFFNEFENNSMLVENKLINEANRNKVNLIDQQNSQLCEFDFTDSSDNLLEIENVSHINPNSSIGPKPPSENSETGEVPRSEVQISTDSITVANSFCDMVDNSIVKSKELAVKTKMVLADESQSSSDVESEIKDHSFIHEKKRRYISSSSSDEEDAFLPKMMIHYMKNHESSNSLADSFHVSRASFESELDGKRNRFFSRGFPSDLYDEILTPLPVTHRKVPKTKI